jgi:hypothetical protein
LHGIKVGVVVVGSHDNPTSVAVNSGSGVAVGRGAFVGMAVGVCVSVGKGVFDGIGINVSVETDTELQDTSDKVMSI